MCDGMANTGGNSELISELLSASFEPAIDEEGINYRPHQLEVSPDRGQAISRAGTSQLQSHDQSSNDSKPQSPMVSEAETEGVRRDQPTYPDNHEQNSSEDSESYSQPDNPLLAERNKSAIDTPPQPPNPLWKWIVTIHKNNWKAAIAGYILIAIIIVLIIIVVSLFKVSSQTTCQSTTPLTFDVPIHKNSTVILRNVTTGTVDLRCFEPIVEITTQVPVDIYQSPCNTLPYSNVSVNRISLDYDNVTNPLPLVFDESYQNYLTNATINVTVNISTVKSDNLSAEELFYFCLFTNYSQVQTFKSLSSKRYWEGYNGNSECTPKPITSGNNTVLTKVFTHSSPAYIFIGVGSTIDPLEKFQFSVSVSGKTISDPKVYGLFEVKECSDISDQNPSCNFYLNPTNSSEALDPLCIIGSRPVDVVSRDPFSNITVKWLRSRPNNAHKIDIAKYAVLALLLLLLLVLVCFCSWNIRAKVKRSLPCRLCSNPITHPTDAESESQ